MNEALATSIAYSVLLKGSLEHGDTGDMLSPEISRIIPFFLEFLQYQERGAALLLLVTPPCDE